MNATYATLHQRLAASLETVPDKPLENADTALRALWFAAAGAPCSLAAAAIGELPPLADAAAQRRLEALVGRRLAGEPVAYLTGRSRFMGLDLLSGPGALIPRIETELLAQGCIDLLAARDAHQAARVIDVCTGSGNLAFAIARQVPGAEVFGADISADALALAARNRDWLKADNVSLCEGDLLTPFGAEFDATVDLVACAPPYITSAKVPHMATEIAAHEPRLAFDGGPLGVTILLRLLEEAPRLLKHGGWLAFEAGLGQGPAMQRRLARDPHYDTVRALTDAHGDIRAILAQRT